jgi:NhaP-type Na+/H+ or K+/H+ antiporter
LVKYNVLIKKVPKPIVSYTIKHGDFKDANQLYSIVALVILISVILHGFTAKKMLNAFDSAKEKNS